MNYTIVEIVTDGKSLSEAACALHTEWLMPDSALVCLMPTSAAMDGRVAELDISNYRLELS